MSHKLKRYMPVIDNEECGLEYPTMRVSLSGNFYSRYEADEYIEELHKKIEALEGVPEEPTEEDITKKKLHYYCFSYSGRSLTCGGRCEASTYTGYSDKKLTKGRVDTNKKFAGVTDEAVLISAAYMGWMTEAELLGDGVTYE